MKKNMGTIDRIIRLSLALIISILYFTNKISESAAIILGIFAIAFFTTSLVGSCPAYIPFNFSTIKKDKK